MTAHLHIIDFGPEKPWQYRYALGTAEPRPDGEPGRWVRVACEGPMVHYRAHMELIATETVNEIITVADEDEVTGW